MPNQEGNAMLNKVKENPIKVVLVLLASLGTIITSGFAFDSRYNQMPQFQQMQYDFRMSRVQDLQNRIFMLQFKISSGKGTPLDEAMLRRYQEQLKALRNKK